MAEKVGVSLLDNEDPAKSMWRLLQCDFRSAKLRRSITGSPTEVREIADRIFDDLPEQERIPALSELVDLLLRTKDPSSDTPLLSARYHLFLRSLEGAFVSYYPEKKVFLIERQSALLLRLLCAVNVANITSLPKRIC